MYGQTDSFFGLNEIGQIAIPVRDVERSIAFYRDILGLKFLFKAPPGLGFFDCGGLRLLLDGAAEAQADTYSSIIYFKVADIQAAFAELSRRGVAFEEPPSLLAKMLDHDLWMAFFRDPDHNLLALMCEIR
jgi:methylmalonyl-CoA/ethylmalonyl-CoA epimerase